MANFLDHDGDLITFLKSVSAITAYIGAGTAARIYPDRARQGKAMPYLSYVQAGGTSYYHHGGVHSLRESVIHFYAFAETDTEANGLIEAVKTALESLMKTTVGSTWVDLVLVDIPDGGDETPKDSSDSYKFWRRAVVNIVHDP